MNPGGNKIDFNLKESFDSQPESSFVFNNPSIFKDGNNDNTATLLIIWLFSNCTTSDVPIPREKVMDSSNGQWSC
jgi:hypothetical protein